MQRGFALLAVLAVAAGAGVLSGCGGRNAAEGPTMQAALEELGQVYRLYAEQKKRPPGKLADLRPYDPIAPTGLLRLECGECVAVWGAGLARTPAAANAVLAYDKNAPQQGGYVLMQDGTVRKMTAQEFQAAPKAKGP